MVLHSSNVRQTAVVTGDDARHIGAPLGVVIGGVALVVYLRGTVHHRVVVVGLERDGASIVGHVARGRHACILRRVDEARIGSRRVAEGICQDCLVGSIQRVIRNKVCRLGVKEVVVALECSLGAAACQEAHCG